MTNIKIIFEEISEQDGRHILKLINDECSIALKQLSLEECRGNVLDEFKKPQLGLNLLSLTTSKTSAIQFTENSKKINVLFPNVCKLRLGSLKDSEWTFMGKFPSLNELQLVLPKFHNKQHFDEKRFENFLKQNENIYLITVVHITLKILQIINKYKPNLEELGLNKFADHFSNAVVLKDNLIRFDTITHLSIHSNQASDKMHESVHFNELEEFSMLLRVDFNENWMKFIKKQLNNRLSEITIDAKSVGREHFLAIAKKFQSIELATFRTTSPYKSDDIEQFLKLNENIQELNVECGMREQELDLLFDKLPERNYMIKTQIDPDANIAFVTIKRYYCEDFNPKINIISVSSHQFISSYRKQSNKETVDCDKNDANKENCENAATDGDNEDDDHDNDNTNSNATSMNKSASILIVILFIAFVY